MLNDFLNQYPETTRSTYAQVLAEFALRVSEPIAGANSDHVADYVNSIREQANSTRHKKLSILQSYFKYLAARGSITINPMVAVRMPKVNRLGSVKFLDEGQITALLRETTDPREQIIISLLLHGLRLAELTGLNVEDYRDGFLKVTGKGDKTRYVPVSDNYQSLLQSFVAGRKSGPMIHSIWNKDHRIERRHIQNLVYRATERIGARMSPHALRHTLATLAFKHNISSGKTQHVLGHASLETTEMYAHLSPEDLREVVNTLPPPNPIEARPALRVMQGGIA